MLGGTQTPSTTSTSINPIAHRAWTGKGDKKEWIDVTRVLEVFSLISAGRVEKKHLRQIDKALKLVAAMNSGQAPDIAVGRDVFENPAAREEQELMEEASLDSGAEDDPDDEDQRCM